MDSWILLGMMGSGKSAVGRHLAEMSGREFVDTDRLIERRFGRSVAQVFSIYGESCFRDHETSVLESLEPAAAVLSTGGGCILRAENWEQFHRLGPTLYLRASAEVLIERLQVSRRKRPLLMRDDWEDALRDILTARTHLYEQADFCIDVTQGEIAEIAEEAHQLFASWRRAA